MTPVPARLLAAAPATMKARGGARADRGWLEVGHCFGDFHLSRLGAAQTSAGLLPTADPRQAPACRDARWGSR